MKEMKFIKTEITHVCLKYASTINSQKYVKIFINCYTTKIMMLSWILMSLILIGRFQCFGETSLHGVETHEIQIQSQTHNR